MKNSSLTIGLCFSGIIAALYIVLTLIFQPISFGAIQFRISEALTLLPILSPFSIWGVSVGCLLANIISGAPLPDIIFGSLATLISALLTYRLRKYIWLAAIPPVICNAVVIGLVLTYAYHIPTLWLNMLTVGIGQAVVCYALGVPFVTILRKKYGNTLSNLIK